MPETEPQHITALRRANEVRFARAALKKRIFEGTEDISEVISKPPDYCLGMQIGELVQSQRRWGPDRTTKFLEAMYIAETKPVRELTERQRILLRTLLG